MNDFLDDLYHYISENTPSLRNDPEYQRAVKAYMEIEAEVKEKIGDDLLSRYQCAEIAVSRHWENAVFLQTLRFGTQLALAVLR